MLKYVDFNSSVIRHHMISNKKDWSSLILRRFGALYFIQ